MTTTISSEYIYIYQNQELNIFWSSNNIDWVQIDTVTDWKVSIQTTSSVNSCSVIFLTDIKIKNVSNTFTILGQNGTINLDGGNFSFTISIDDVSGSSGNSSGQWPGLIKTIDNLTHVLNISNFVMRSESNTTLLINSGYLCQYDFCKNSNCNLTVSNCTNYGIINNQYCGGLFGTYFCNSSQSIINISNCTNQGSIYTGGAAGLFGANAFYDCNATVNIYNCINTASMTSNGCCGFFAGDAAFVSGGNQTRKIQNCVNTGDISGENCAGFTKHIYEVLYYNCYSNGQLSGNGSASFAQISDNSSNLVNNCYVLYGVFPRSGNNLYTPNGNWNLENALNNLKTISDPPVWVYDKTDNVTDTTQPFVLYSMYPNYDVVSSPELSILPIETKTILSPPFNLNITTLSTAAITYTLTNPIATIAVGENNVSTVTITGVGSTDITAVQSSSTNYNSDTTTVTLTVLNANTMTFADILATVGDADKTLTASSTNTNGPTITYVSDNTSVGSVNGSTLTIGGNGTANITATQQADSNYDGAEKTAILTVLDENTMTFADIFATVGDADKTLSAITTNTNGPTITYVSDNTSVGSVNGTTLTIGGKGTANITATQQADSNYDGAEKTVILTVLDENTMTFADIFATVGDADKTLSATTTNTNGPIITYVSDNTSVGSVNGSTLTIGVKGTANITATQQADSNYDGAENTAILTVLNANYGGYLLYDTSSGSAIVIGAKYSIYNLEIPSQDGVFTVIGIKDSAFLNGLTTSGTLSGTIEFPPTLAFIGASAFQGCSELSGYLKLPESITSIGKSAFLGCGFTGALTLPPLLEVLEEGVFDRCSFTSLAPPTNLRSIGAYVFYDNPMFVYDFTQCEQLIYIDPSAFNMSGRYDFLDINVYVTAFTYERIRNIPFPKYVKLHTGVPVSNICFIAGTLVETDQGNLPIETLTRKNTLRGQPIQVTKSKHDDPYLVKIQAYAFTDIPTKDTYMSMNHRVYFNHDRVKARDLVNGDTITFVDYTGEPLYNLLVKAHTSMLVYGLRVETLDPKSVIALLYTSKLSPNQKTILIEKMNRQTEYDDLVIHLKRNQ